MTKGVFEAKLCCSDGRQEGAQEGQELGLQKGFELAQELGFYRGCLQVHILMLHVMHMRLQQQTVGKPDAKAAHGT